MWRQTYSHLQRPTKKHTQPLYTAEDVVSSTFSSSQVESNESRKDNYDTKEVKYNNNSSLKQIKNSNLL